MQLKETVISRTFSYMRKNSNNQWIEESFDNLDECEINRYEEECECTEIVKTEHKYVQKIVHVFEQYAFFYSNRSGICSYYMESDRQLLENTRFVHMMEGDFCSEIEHIRREF
jgi:hypothetical protein